MINYSSRSAKAPVRFFPRTAEKEPYAVTTLAHADGAARLAENLRESGGGVPELIYNVDARGLAADVVASLWAKHTKVVATLRAEEDPGARVQGWKGYAAGVLAMQGDTQLSSAQAKMAIVADLDQHKAGLHPVAEAMHALLAEEIQLVHLNGSTPKPELLPPTAFVDPVEAMGIIALDLS